MLQIDVLHKGRNYWDSAVASEPVKAMEKGQIVTLGFFARAASTDGPVWLNAMVAQIAAPYAPAVITRVELDSEVKMYCIEGVSKISLRNGEGKVTLHIAGERQSIDLGPFLVTVRDPADGASQLPCGKVLQSW